MRALSPKLKARLKDKGDILYQDFKSIDDATQQCELNLHNVRGSIRLRMGRILLPMDIKKLADKVLNSKLP